MRTYGSKGIYGLVNNNLSPTEHWSTHHHNITLQTRPPPPPLLTMINSWKLNVSKRQQVFYPLVPRPSGFPATDNYRLWFLYHTTWNIFTPFQLGLSRTANIKIKAFILMFLCCLYWYKNNTRSSLIFLAFEIIMIYYLENEFFLYAHQNMHTHFFLYFKVSMITYRLQQ